MGPESRQMWKLETCDIEFPTFEKLLSVLNKRMDALQGVKPETLKRHPFKEPAQKSRSMHTAPAVICALCGKDHKLYDCAEFLALSIQQRRDYVKKHSPCFNCLSDSHGVYQYLHLDIPTSTSAVNSLATGSGTTCGHANSVENAILPTAQIKVEGQNGDWQYCRALLDTGSQTSFVTEECFQRLGLKKTNGRILIQGLNDVTSGVSKGAATIRVKSRFIGDVYEITAKVLIVPKISSYKAEIKGLNRTRDLNKIRLADPNFDKEGKIEVLLGSDIFFDIICDGKMYIPKTQLVAHNTNLGWVIAGTPIHDEVENKETKFSLHLDVDLTIRKFGEIEEINDIVHYSEEEIFCLEHFRNTICRAEDGRYIVSLPFKNGHQKLGNSKTMAIKRMCNLEKRFLRDVSFKRKYSEFMDEYVELGHMKIDKDSGLEQYYLPHHGVFKESSATTKLRVVFDGSAKTSHGNSLKDQLAVGPVVQSTLTELLLRFRTHKIIFTADIEKMFRQIWVDKKDTEFQKIVWRKESEEDLHIYRLLTTIKANPEASEVLKRDFYVDDLLSGTNDVKNAQKIVQDLICLLRKGGFNLRKWASNSSELMCTIPESNKESSYITFEDDQAVSVLGVRYSPTHDNFRFKVNLVDHKFTKRSMLSEAAKIFDPIGWLSPTIIRIKILFQRLWLLGVDWDEQLPNPIYDDYTAIRSTLIRLEDIRIDRWLYVEDQELELHGFPDASELAYAAVIYSRVKTADGFKINLVTAKTKVAPIKTISIPRLELSAAVLLTKLLASILETFKFKLNITFRLWTDSTIVLNWISSCPRRWQCYVANRVSLILQQTNRSQWSHISSSDNPADCASRGLLPEELVNYDLWWNGPHWLKRSEFNWPSQAKFNLELPEAALKEEKKKSVVLLNVRDNNDWMSGLIDRCSKFSKIVFVIARILLLFRKKTSGRSDKGLKCSQKYNEAKRDALNLIIRGVQSSSFAFEINALANNKPINRDSKLISLFPFIDKVGLLRVGGRLYNADVPYDVKHPLIIPTPHRVTTLIIRDEHIKQLHAGPTLLISTLNQNYHILRCKNEGRKVLKQCIKCVRLKAQQQQQLMGQLPQHRVSYHRPFFTTGVDYAGPLFIKASRLRGAKIIKLYLALFVCMATKAVHLELVGDMTTEAFLASLPRFHARRVISGHIYSDNGSNFVGAQRDLQRCLTMIEKDATLMRYITSHNIEWHFIPPGAPNFGGLWEAGIKSTKYHLKRVIGETLLTFEEMTTLLTQIECLLNSRPLSEISSDDMDPLTPGHFLIGHPITLMPEPNLLDIKENRLSRWQHIQRMVQHFWQRWHTEYLVTLQQRSKWKISSTNPVSGDLVVVIDKDVPPTKWLMGRITQTIPGQDGLVRVVVIKTKLGEIKRPISKICMLPSGSVESAGAGCSG